MYSLTPKHKNTAAKISALLSLLVGALTFIFALGNTVPYPSVAQFLGLALMTFAVYIASVYLLRQYTYSIEPDTDGGYDFIINEHRSNKLFKVCHIPLRDVTNVKVMDRGNRAEIRAARKDKKRFTYSTEFAASRYIEVSAITGGEDVSVLVPYDEKLEKLLSSLRQ